MIQKISYKDNLKIQDTVNNIIKRNYARIIIDDEVVEDKIFNMVVLPGREVIAEKLFGLYASNTGDYRNYLITHFGIGSGGSVINSGSIVELLGPDLCDTDLRQPIQLDPGNNSYLTSPSGVHYVCKPITADGSFVFVGNDETCPNNAQYYTTVQCNCIVNNHEPTYLQPSEYVKVDEAMLYVTYNGNTRAFARITFPPKFITADNILHIEWYIIC
jgi:hypothetical protein